MIRFEPLTAEHAVRIGPLEAIHAGFEMTAEMAVMLEEVGGTAAVVDGEVVALAGILPRWEGVGMAWAWLTRKWRRHARRITAEMQLELSRSDYHRVEIGVKAGFHRGEAFAQRLGFYLETPVARGWGPDGGDYSIWVRVKE